MSTGLYYCKWMDRQSESTATPYTVGVLLLLGLLLGLPSWPAWSSTSLFTVGYYFYTGFISFLFSVDFLNIISLLGSTLITLFMLFNIIKQKFWELLQFNLKISWILDFMCYYDYYYYQFSIENLWILLEYFCSFHFLYEISKIFDRSKKTELKTLLINNRKNQLKEISYLIWTIAWLDVFN